LWRDTSCSRLRKEESGREVYSSGERSSKSGRARASIEIPRSVTLFVDRVYQRFAWKWLEGFPWISRDHEARSSKEFRRSWGPQEWWRGRWSRDISSRELKDQNIGLVSDEDPRKRGHELPTSRHIGSREFELRVVSASNGEGK
jgi:hypothetical protein